MMESQVASTAKNFSFMHPNLLLLSELWLYTLYPGTLSVFVQIIWPFWISRLELGYIYTPLRLSSASWKHWWWRERTRSTRNPPSPRSDVFADRACVVTAQVWMLKHRQSLTKTKKRPIWTLAQHKSELKKAAWHRGYSLREREPKSNPVHSRNLLFFPPLFVDFSPLCPCRLTGFGDKDISDLNAVQKSNWNTSRREWGGNTSDYLGGGVVLPTLWEANLCDFVCQIPQ